jgi:hypothetical protein
MSYRKLFKISILVLAVAAIALVLLPASATAQSKITCISGGGCASCWGQCQNGFVCSSWGCSDGTSGGGCSPCVFAQKQPSDLQKGTHGEQRDKVLLARLLSKDPELSQALRSLK